MIATVLVTSWNSLFLGEIDEGVNVFKAGEVGDWLLDLLDGVWDDSVCSFAQQCSVLQKSKEVFTVSASRDVLSAQLLDPFKQELAFLFVEFGGLLQDSVVGLIFKCTLDITLKPMPPVSYLH